MAAVLSPLPFPVKVFDVFVGGGSSVFLIKQIRTFNYYYPNLQLYNSVSSFQAIYTKCRLHTAIFLKLETLDLMSGTNSESSGP